ncbi:MAG TPA: TIGR00366 family protein [Terriglobia bacterium]|nr:TIGR00366 family protein [Terriglobia bacterium]
MNDLAPQNDARSLAEGPLARVGTALANWSERWFPDPLVFAFLGVVAVFAIGVLAGESPAELVLQGGNSFWALVPFTMQMVMIIIGGYVVSSSPPVYRAIQRVAQWPKSPRGAVALTALLSMMTSLVSWGLSLIFSAFLVRELAQRLKGLDYRAAAAAGYLGLGSVWAMGLSSSAAMLMATESSLPPALRNISGLIPLTQTIFLWPSIATTAVLVASSVLIAYLSAPAAENARTAEQYGIRFEVPGRECAAPARPGEYLEHSPILPLMVAAMLGGYLVHLFFTSPQGALAALDLNTYNLIFLALGLALQWRPRNFVRAVADSMPGVGGVLIQYPFYAMIFGMIAGTGLSEKAARLFVSLSTPDTYALLVAAYSALLGVFIPSGGSKWVIEAPYVLAAAVEHRIHLGWVVQIYNAAEALPNLFNPFFMLPLLGIVKLRARDLVGYSMLQLVLHIPIVFFFCWLFSRSLAFIPPQP